MTVAEYVKKRLEMAEKKEERRREQNRRRKEQKEDDGRMTCPPQIRVAKDLAVLERLIGQYRGIRKEAAAWIEKNKADILASEAAQLRLEATLGKAAAAVSFLNSLPEEELKELWYPENWSKYPQLNYRDEMDGLYDNHPLRQYREENGELMKGRKYKKFVA